MNRQTRPLWALLIFSFSLIVFSKWKVDASYQWRYPVLTEMIVTEHYAGDLGAIMLGARRMGADIAYIQFLQYYGTPSHSHEEESPEAHKDDIHHFEGGSYPRVKEMGMRLLRLDPFFNAPVLEISAALAYNLGKIDQGLDLLAEGIRRDPAFYRYRLYVAAILYKNDRKDKDLIGLLEQAIQYPDCPVLFENILGNLFHKYGMLEKAVWVYSHIVETAAYESDRDTARRKLEKLSSEHPELGNFAILGADRR